MVRTLNVITLLSDLLHNWETGQRRQVHDYLEAPSSDFYEPPADQYGPPQDHYRPPQDHYGPPQDHYGPPRINSVSLLWVHVADLIMFIRIRICSSWVTRTLIRLIIVKLLNSKACSFLSLNCCSSRMPL